MKRKVVRIDETKCNGCGLCIPNCPEGALQIIDGKARLVSEIFCDGLGACIGTCPQDAITVEEVEAQPYDERKAIEKIIKAGRETIKAHLEHLKKHGEIRYLKDALQFLKEKGITGFEEQIAKEKEPACGCPGGATMDLRGEQSDTTEITPGQVQIKGELKQWPVQLRLLNPYAPYFQDADILVAADCVPFAYAGFHPELLRGKSLIIFCPKLDVDIESYVEKLAELFSANSIKSITAVHMEVPCCFGLIQVIKEALKKAGKQIPIEEKTITIRGKMLEG
ncbi:MAG: ATP-binding protein [bacterium]